MYTLKNGRFTFCCLLFLILLCPGLSGCGYGKVSPRTYEISKALYSICNRKKSEKIEQVSDLVATSLKEEKITKRESQWLNEIISKATQGDWEFAAQQSRKIMEDQVIK